MKEHTLKIKEIIDEAPLVKTFRMHLPSDFPMDFFPGQFFMVHFPGNATFKRAYSIASSPTDHGFLDITLDLVGEFTKKLWGSQAGDELVFIGPYGKFYFNDSMKNDMVLIAGGLGITPMRSILRYCKDKKLPNKINLLYSVKKLESIIYQKELDDYKNQLAHYSFIPTLTRLDEDHAWQGRVGRINMQLLKDNVFNITNDLFFLCGSNEFVKVIRDMLYEMGTQKEHIKTDIWGE